MNHSEVKRMKQILRRGKRKVVQKNLRFVCPFPKGRKTKILMGNCTVFLSASLQGRGKRKESHSFCQNQDFQDSRNFQDFILNDDGLGQAESCIKTNTIHYSPLTTYISLFTSHSKRPA